MIEALRILPGTVLLVAGIVLLLAARAEYRRQRWMAFVGRCGYVPFAALIVLAAIALSASAWLLRII